MVVVVMMFDNEKLTKFEKSSVEQWLERIENGWHDEGNEERDASCQNVFNKRCGGQGSSFNGFYHYYVVIYILKSQSIDWLWGNDVMTAAAFLLESLDNDLEWGCLTNGTVFPYKTGVLIFQFGGEIWLSICA